MNPLFNKLNANAPGQHSPYNLSTKKKNTSSPGSLMTSQDYRAYTGGYGGPGSSSSSSVRYANNGVSGSGSSSGMRPSSMTVTSAGYDSRRQTSEGLRPDISITKLPPTANPNLPSTSSGQRGGSAPAPMTSIPLSSMPSTSGASGSKPYSAQVKTKTVPAADFYHGRSYLYPQNPNNPIAIVDGPIAIHKLPHPQTHKIDSSKIIRVHESDTSVRDCKKMLQESCVVKSRPMSVVVNPRIYPAEFKASRPMNSIDFRHDVEAASKTSYMSIFSHRPNPEKYPDNTVSYVHSVYKRKDQTIIEKESQFFRKKTELACATTNVKERVPTKDLLQAREARIAAQAAAARNAAFDKSRTGATAPAGPSGSNTSTAKK